MDLHWYWAVALLPLSLRIIIEVNSELIGVMRHLALFSFHLHIIFFTLFQFLSTSMELEVFFLYCCLLSWHFIFSFPFCSFVSFSSQCDFTFICLAPLIIFFHSTFMSISFSFIYLNITLNQNFILLFYFDFTTLSHSSIFISSSYCTNHIVRLQSHSNKILLCNNPHQLWALTLWLQLVMRRYIIISLLINYD